MKIQSNIAYLICAATAVLGADLGGAISGVSSAADKIKQELDSWSSGSGLQGALGIQGDFPALQSSVEALSKAVQGASDSDIDTKSIKSLTSSITGLLDELTKKASDFSSVGAKGIVSSDVSGVVTPAESIINSIASIVQSDCQKVSDLNPEVSSISAAFASANSAYGLPQAKFPGSVSCAGGSGGSSATSSASSSGSSSESASGSSKESSGSADSVSLPTASVQNLNSTHASASSVQSSPASGLTMLPPAIGGANSLAIPSYAACMLGAMLVLL